MKKEFRTDSVGGHPIRPIARSFRVDAAGAPTADSMSRDEAISELVARYGEQIVDKVSGRSDAYVAGMYSTMVELRGTDASDTTAPAARVDAFDPSRPFESPRLEGEAERLAAAHLPLRGPIEGWRRERALRVARRDIHSRELSRQHVAARLRGEDE